MEAFLETMGLRTLSLKFFAICWRRSLRACMCCLSSESAFALLKLNHTFIEMQLILFSLLFQVFLLTNRVVLYLRTRRVHFALKSLASFFVFFLDREAFFIEIAKHLPVLPGQTNQFSLKNVVWISSPNIPRRENRLAP